MVARDFRTSVLPYSGKLLRMATLLLKNEEDARDAVQDVFLKLWQKREELDKIENMEAFAVRMIRNRCFDRIRAGRVEEMKTDTMRTLTGYSDDVHSRIELSETARQITNLIGTLPELQRRIMQMKDIEQFTYEEIGELTGLNANAIRVNLSRARKKVRDELLKSEENEKRGNKEAVGSLF